MAPLACKGRKLGHLVLIDTCTEQFFFGIVPLHKGPYSTLSPFTQCNFKMGTRLTGDILLGVSLWWTSIPSRGSSNTLRHCMTHAKESGISFGCLDLWPMCTNTLLLNVLNVILNLSKYQSQSHQLAVWSLRSEDCSLKSAGRVLQTVRSAVWVLHSVCGGLQVEFCSLRPTLWGLQSEVCRSSSAASEHWGLQSELCSL